MRDGVALVTWRARIWRRGRRIPLDSVGQNKGGIQSDGFDVGKMRMLKIPAEKMSRKDFLNNSDGGAGDHLGKDHSDPEIHQQSNTS